MQHIMDRRICLTNKNEVRLEEHFLFYDPYLEVLFSKTNICHFLLWNILTPSLRKIKTVQRSGGRQAAIDPFLLSKTRLWARQVTGPVALSAACLCYPDTELGSRTGQGLSICSVLISFKDL